MRPRTRFVAELGANIFPYTRRKLAEMIYQTAAVGADAVKVQLFHADHFPASERKQKRLYQFPREEFAWFVRYAHQNGLKAGASVFDEGAVLLCADDGADFVKLATREQGNGPLREQCQHHFHRTILRSVRWPVERTIKRWSREITLGCIPDYPADDRTAWSSVHSLFLELPEPAGWSSHTNGWFDCFCAYQRGARVIEKHMYGMEDDPECLWSLSPDNFHGMIETIRAHEAYVKTRRQ